MIQLAPSAPPTSSEIQAMAGVLARRYGPRAGEIARNFLLEHLEIGDHARAAVWEDVCVHLEQNASPPTLS